MSSVSSPGSSRVTSPFRVSGSALKYTPYDPPEIIPRMRTRPSSSRSFHSKLSDPGQVSLHTHASLPMTPGNLTSAAGLELEMSNVILYLVVNITTKFLTLIYFVAPTFSCRCIGTMGFTGGNFFMIYFCSFKLPGKPSRRSPRVDLITLDSPFSPDRFGSTEEPMANHDDFEDIWNSFNVSCDLRGWCSASIDNVTRRLQCVEDYRLAVIATELPPFIGRSTPPL